jgi:predicted RNA-binding Zn-ribbon protein involved in translation (DUF1610 family)
MTSIRTTCPRCGEVEMRAEVVLLSVDPGSGEGSYSFVCPVCEDLVEKPADQKIVNLLRSIGVDVAERPQVDPVDPRPEGPPLTLDDVIDFHFLLDREDWFGRLVASAE